MIKEKSNNLTCPFWSWNGKITKEEISEYIYKSICKYIPNVIIKWGRYIPGQKPHYDDVLGVYLASGYIERISPRFSTLFMDLIRCKSMVNFLVQIAPISSKSQGRR